MWIDKNLLIPMPLLIVLINPFLYWFLYRFLISFLCLKNLPLQALCINITTFFFFNITTVISELAEDSLQSALPLQLSSAFFLSASHAWELISSEVYHTDLDLKFFWFHLYIAPASAAIQVPKPHVFCKNLCWFILIKCSVGTLTWLVFLSHAISCCVTSWGFFLRWAPILSLTHS